MRNDLLRLPVDDVFVDRLTQPLIHSPASVAEIAAGVEEGLELLLEHLALVVLPPDHACGPAASFRGAVVEIVFGVVRPPLDAGNRSLQNRDVDAFEKLDVVVRVLVEVREVGGVIGIGQAASEA